MTMVAQNISASSDAHRRSKPNIIDSRKIKRVRTKHACDECRRSQKKCDGDKPLCRRCYLNGTNCTYTPHKSRNQCLYIAQGEEPPVDASAPDVFIFADPSLSSFHTWSATTSPDQSPSASEPALSNPSVTNLSQDVRFGSGSARNAALELPASLHESEIIPAPDMIVRNRGPYKSRCYSPPNSPSAGSISSSPHAIGFSPLPASVFLPKNPISQSALTGHELGHVLQFSTGDAFHSVDDNPFPSSDSRGPPAEFPEQCSANYGSYFDASTQCNQASLNAQFYHAESSCSTELVEAHSSYYPSCVRQHSIGPVAQGCLSSETALQVLRYPIAFNQTNYSSPLMMHGNGNESHLARSYERTSGQLAGRAAIFPCSQRVVNPASIRERRQNTGMMLPYFPSSTLHHNQWSVGITSPVLIDGYPNSANPSSSNYSLNDFYDWSQQR